MNTVIQMQDLSQNCGKNYFRKDEELFLTIYSIYLFNKRQITALSLRQARQIHRLWETYCK